jgi:hypothetical protein
MSVDQMNCTDPEVGRLLFRWAMLHGQDREGPQDSILAKHLESCAACANSVGLWRQKAEAAMLIAEAERARNRNLLAHENVEEKPLEGGKRILFKFSSEDPLTGLLVVITEEGKIESVSAATRTAFDDA